MLTTIRLRFFAIVGGAVLLVLVFLTLQQMKLVTPLATTQITLTVAVAPELADWVTTAARAFHHNAPDVVIQVQAMPGLRALKEFPGRAPPALPHLWLPEASWLAAAGQAQVLPYTNEDGSSAAQTFLQWGAFQSRVEALGKLNWPAVRQAVQVRNWLALGGAAAWGQVKLVLASPTSSAKGIAVLLAAAADYQQQANLTESMVTEPALLNTLQLMLERVPSFTTLGPTPAAVLATRGSAVGDVGLLTAAEWQQVMGALHQVEPFVTQTPSLTVEFDYPILIRQALHTSEKATAIAFRDFLLAQARQQPPLGLTQPLSNTRIIHPEPAAVLALLRWAENAELER